MRWMPFEIYGPRYFEDNEYNKYDMQALILDQFYINIQDPQDELWEKHKDCVGCVYQNAAKNKIGSLLYEYQIKSKIHHHSCNLDSSQFGEFGVYNVYTNCTIEEVREPVNAYLPLLSCAMFYLVIAILYYFWKRKRTSSEDATSSNKKRMMSIDAFRGVTIVMMIFANYGCGGYHFIEHAAWNGLHVADLIFPWFMWIMGVCIPISLKSKFKREETNWEILKDVGMRSLKLFCIGVFLSSGSNVLKLRIMGVLQRFGIAYFVVTTICLFLMDRKNRTGIFRDVIKLWKGWIVVIFILICHTLIVFLVAEEGCPRGYLGPGGLHNNATYSQCVGGATGYIDRKILTYDHVYQNPTISKVFETVKPFDPEGFVGCLTTIVHVFIGVQAGIIMLEYKGHKSKLIRWLTWAVICGAIGAGLCGFSKEYGIIPVNKNLWSLSFVMVTTCFAFTALSAMYVVVDMKQWWTGQPFTYAGMNAILMYIGHEMSDGHFPVRWSYEDDSSVGQWKKTHFIALMSDTWAAFMWLLVACYCYKIKFFLKI